MTGDDCAHMGDKSSQSHDPECIVTCALVCSGPYTGPEMALAATPAFQLAEYSIPATDPIITPPSLLDPPPPRL
jgi:hypothetical protein